VKPLFIILALIGVMFVAILLASGANSEKVDPVSYQPPALVKIVGSVLGRWSPRVKFPKTDFTVSGEPIVIDVPPAEDPDDTYRTAKVRVAPPNCGSVTIEFTPRDVGADGVPEKTERWQATEADPCVGSFAVKPKGGTLKVTCAPQQVCRIGLEP
jgi:hypothetical protein